MNRKSWPTFMGKLSCTYEVFKRNSFALFRTTNEFLSLNELPCKISGLLKQRTDSKSVLSSDSAQCSYLCALVFMAS